MVATQLAGLVRRSVLRPYLRAPLTVLKDHPLLVHLHIPKTAGVSFYQHFKANFPSNFHVDHRDLAQSVAAYAAGEKILLDEFVTGHVDIDMLAGVRTRRDVAIISVLREPIGRYISHFNYNKSPAHTWSEEFKRQYPKFEQFVLSDKFGRNPMFRALFGQNASSLEDALPFFERFRYLLCTTAAMGPFSRYIIAEYKKAVKGRIERVNEIDKSHDVLRRQDISPELMARITEENHLDAWLFALVAETESLVLAEIAEREKRFPAVASA